MLQPHFTALYGAGIMMLLTIQVLIASGLNKREVCSLSAIGITPCILAAGAMMNWSLLVISLCWLLICAWGSPIIERKSKPGASDHLTLFLAFVPLMIWIAMPDYLIWACVVSLQLVWLLFAWGLACRPIYLLSIIAAALPALPGLIAPTSPFTIGFETFWFGACAFVLLWIYVAASRTRPYVRPLW